MSIPNTMLKAVWMIHFVLSSWAMFSGFIAVNTYWYTHAGVLAFGFWAIVAPDSVDAVIMFMVSLTFSVLNDIICLGLYQPRGDKIFERAEEPRSYTNEYRWALGMAITNVLAKPVTIFLLYRVYQSRSTGSEFDTGIPGLDRATRQNTGYSNIDQHDGQSKSSHVYQEPPSSNYQSPPPPAQI